MALGPGLRGRYRGVTRRSTAPSGSAIVTYDPGTPSELNLYNQHAGAGNTFTTPAGTLTVTGGRVELRRVGEMQGLFRFVVSATSGGVATGAPLTTSPWYALDSVDFVEDDVYFTLDSWSPSESTVYALLLEQYDNMGKRSASDPHLRINYASGGGYADGQRLTSADVFPDPLTVNGGTGAAGDVYFEIYGTAASSGPTLLGLTGLLNIVNLQGDALVIALLFLGSL